MRYRAVLIVCTAVLAAAIVTPAFGGPSLGSVARTAKKALKTANAGVKIIDAESGDVPAPPADFARFDVRCPRGYVPTGFGTALGALEIVAVLSVSNGYIGSYFNPSDTTTFTGSLGVQCAKGRSLGIRAGAVANAAAARREIRAAEENRLALHKQQR